MSRLPKIQPPADLETRQKVVEASEFARDGDMKAAQKALKEVVASGAIVPAVQRQVLAWWSAGEYDLPGFQAESPSPEGGSETLAERPPQRRAPSAVAIAAPKLDEYEAAMQMVMKKKNQSRKEAAKYIEEGGLEAEQMEKEMYSPMDDAFDKIKDAGPPQWFIDAFSNTEGEDGQPALPGQEASPDRLALEEKIRQMAAEMVPPVPGGGMPC